jgi:hypothetical protein
VSRYLIIVYDKQHVCVNRLKSGQVPPASLEVEDVLCEGSSFDDVVRALEEAFTAEMNPEQINERSTTAQLKQSKLEP